MVRASGHFAGKHALITGGSSGIGLAIARRLVDLGAGVTVVARRPEPLRSAAAVLSGRRGGARVRMLSLDVSDQAAVTESVPRELAEQPIDAVVNAAGVSHPRMFLDATPEELREQMEVNYWGTVWVTRAAVSHLLERGGGNLVIMGSIAGRIGVHGYAGYTRRQRPRCSGLPRCCGQNSRRGGSWSRSRCPRARRPRCSSTSARQRPSQSTG